MGVDDGVEMGGIVQREKGLTPVDLRGVFGVGEGELEVVGCHFDGLIRRIADVELKLAEEHGGAGLVSEWVGVHTDFKE